MFMSAELAACILSKMRRTGAQSRTQLTFLSPLLEGPCLLSVGDVVEVNGCEGIALMSHKLQR